MEIEDVIYDFNYSDDTGVPIRWTPSQLSIIEAIIKREFQGKRRVHIETLTQYGKSASVAAGVTTSAAVRGERWSIIGANEDKASIIMGYILQYAVDDSKVRTLLDYDGPLDKLKRERSRKKISFKGNGAVQILTANVTSMKDMGRTLMGFGSRNVIEDDSALIPDKAHAQAIRMIGGRGDEGFFVKIGNPFERNHFLRSYNSDRWAKIIVDSDKAIEEGRFTREFIEEVREEINDPVLFGILYECKFPEEGMIDEGGWIPLFKDSDIENAMMDEIEPFGEERLGADVAAGGRNNSVVVWRAKNMARVAFKGREPDTMQFAGRIIRGIQKLRIHPSDVCIDAGGPGKGCADRVKEIFQDVRGIMFGASADNKNEFVNKRAEMYWRIRDWILSGGKLARNDAWYELLNIRYKVASDKKLKIMPKEMMLKKGIASPDTADALALTFATSENTQEAPVIGGRALSETSPPTRSAIDTLDPFA